MAYFLNSTFTLYFRPRCQTCLLCLTSWRRSWRLNPENENQKRNEKACMLSGMCKHQPSFEKMTDSRFFFLFFFEIIFLNKWLTMTSASQKLSRAVFVYLLGVWLEWEPVTLQVKWNLFMQALTIMFRVETERRTWYLSWKKKKLWVTMLYSTCMFTGVWHWLCPTTKNISQVTYHGSLWLTF